jgi:hypothetical protein
MHHLNEGVAFAARGAEKVLKYSLRDKRVSMRAVAPGGGGV